FCLRFDGRDEIQGLARPTGPAIAVHGVSLCDAGRDLVAGAVVRFREDQERRSVFGRRCGRTLAGTLRSEGSSVLRADIAVVRKADAMRTATREFNKI
ncbi:hypothetical protein AB9F36_25945, partial [Rhizobium leguminosarum]|uniref:hypothetical protein n=1 Tax=Rhizobium leguminosarum TaxID=384 RepID=UPI003F99C2FE